MYLVLVYSRFTLFIWTRGFIFLIIAYNISISQNRIDHYLFILRYRRDKKLHFANKKKEKKTLPYLFTVILV